MSLGQVRIGMAVGEEGNSIIGYRKGRYEKMLIEI